MCNIPISQLKKGLDQKLGKDSWVDYEVETLVIETGLPYSDLLRDKLHVLKIIEAKPTIFFDEVLFLVFATNVINNEIADFEYLPHIKSLEVAFAIEEMAKILEVELHQLPEFAMGPKYLIRDILISEGYSEVLPPFDVVGIGQLPKGQTEQDTLDKKKAIEAYLHAMFN